MKKKSMMCFAIINCLVCLSLIVFGVYAAVSVTLSISGTISFTAYDKEVYINSVNVNNCVVETEEGYSTTTTTLENFNGVYANPKSVIDISNVTVLQGETAEIAINMMSVKSSYLKCNLTYDALPEGVKVQTTSVYLPKNLGESVQTGQSKTYKIYITNTNSGDLSLNDLNLKISFEEKTSILQHDSTNQYYYVEMGTIARETEIEYIKWKYVSSTGTSRYTYSTTTPTGIGYFVLQTDTLVEREDGYYLNQCNYSNDYTYQQISGTSTDYTKIYHTKNGWNNILANDYATSEIRQYINGNKVYKRANYTSTKDTSVTPNVTTYLASAKTDGDYSDMYTDFNIDTQNDIVYENIIGRTLSDLYKNNAPTFGDDNNISTTADVAFPDFTNADIVISENEVDKFWLMSALEAQNLLGGGAWMQNDLDWLTEGDMVDDDYYWLRSPRASYSCVAYSVGGDGDWDTYNVSYDFNAARAAFKMAL